MNEQTNPHPGSGGELTSEILIMADGLVLAHNLTPIFTAMLGELNPNDPQFSLRDKHTNSKDDAS